MGPRPEERQAGHLLEEAIDWEAVRSSDVELRFTAVDVCTGEREQFDNENAGPEALLASTAIPLVFPVEEVEGHYLWDGGLLSGTPLQPAIEAGATEVYAILNDPVHRPARAPPANLAEALDRVIDIVNQRALRKDLRRAEEINELVRRDQGADYWHQIDFHLVAPEEELEADVLSFEEDEARMMWRCGYDDAKAYLEGTHADQQALETFGQTPEWARHEQADEDEGAFYA